MSRPIFLVGKKLHEVEESKSVRFERIPVDEFAVAPPAAAARFLSRPREKSHWDVVDELRFPRSLLPAVRS